MPTRSIREVVKNQKILTTTGKTTVFEAARLMADARVGAIMILEGQTLAGIFTERDALLRVLAAGLDPKTTPLETVMTSSPLTASPDRPLGHALHIMYDGGFRHVPIVEKGKPVGMVSARDALGPELVAFENELEQRDVITERL